MSETSLGPLPRAWTWLDSGSASIAEAELKRELSPGHRELSPGHALAGREAKAIARSHSKDDYLYELLDEPGTRALVHLTWSRSGPERPPWPHAVLLQSFEDFLEEAQRRD